MPTHNQSKSNCTIYFDGACPLCSKEIALYQKWEGGEKLNWVDASKCSDEELGANLSRSEALARLHCRNEQGQLVHGAAAFVVIWSRLRGLNLMSRIFASRPALAFLELCYRGFLMLRRKLRR